MYFFIFASCEPLNCMQFGGSVTAGEVSSSSSRIQFSSDDYLVDGRVKTFQMT